MSFVQLLVFLFIAGVCSASPVSRITNGSPTTIEWFPGIVQLEFFDPSRNVWSQSCGGNILNQIYILSAAQCTDVRIDPTFTPANRRIRAGATYRNTGGLVRHVASVVNHPQYNFNQSHNADITIIRLSEWLVFGDGIRGIAILAQGFVIPHNANVTHAGWGALTNFGPPSEVLRYVGLLHKSDCDVPMNFTQNMICANSAYNNIAGACYGDVGGPMYYSGVIAGVITWFAGCQNLIPTVSTRVASYTDWILQNTP